VVLLILIRGDPDHFAGLVVQPLEPNQ
jgi:hypothetical protein